MGRAHGGGAFGRRGRTSAPAGDFADLATRVRDLPPGAGRVVIFQEGGYNLAAMAPKVLPGLLFGCSRGDVLLYPWSEGVSSTDGVVFADNGLQVLSEPECVRLLEGSRVGRMATVLGGVPAVLPVTYAMVGGDVMFFTGEGVKLNAARRSEWVSFEVDHIDLEEQWGWSVLVAGRASVAARGARARAEALGLYPWAAGDRPHLVRIRPELISGRRVLTGREPEMAVGSRGHGSATRPRSPQPNPGAN